MRVQIAATRIWPISLEQIDVTVADYVGPGRMKSRSPAAVFSRHVSMYLAKNVGGWCYPKISRFYGCKHHATVSCAVRKIGRLRVSDESVDDLIEMLMAALSPDLRSGQAHVAKSKYRVSERQACRLLEVDRTSLSTPGELLLHWR